MAIDILKFLTLYLLVLFAFACGMNQLLWYYADLEYEKCYSLPGGQQNLQGEVKYGKHGKVVKLRPYCMHCIFHIRYSLFCKDFRLENLYYIFWRLYIFYADWWMMLILNLYFHLQAFMNGFLWSFQVWPTRNLIHIVQNSIWLKKNRASDNEGKFHSFLMCRIWIYSQKLIS